MARASAWLKRCNPLVLGELLGESVSTALLAWVEATQHLRPRQKQRRKYVERLKRLELMFSGSEDFDSERDEMLGNLAKALLLRTGDALYPSSLRWWSRISDPPGWFASGYAQLLWEKQIDQIFGSRWYSDQYAEWERMELVRLIRRLAAVLAD